jgi:hypothetical protein
MELRFKVLRDIAQTATGELNAIGRLIHLVVSLKIDRLIMCENR